MLKKEIIVNRNKKELDIYKKYYSNKKGIINRYERQINYYKDELCKKDLIIQNNIDKVENLMIVAHPDDETIFGMNELYNKENWLLIICTNSMDGRIGLMRKDIPGVIQMSKDYNFNLVVIQHFDMYEKIVNTRFDITVYNYLKEYLLKQKWRKIITHNKDGEYGHPQHILVHQMVSNILFNNNVSYIEFKVFDFNDNVSNDITIVKNNILKYYLCNPDQVNNYNCVKAYSRKTKPSNYDMTNLLCV